MVEAFVYGKLVVDKLSACQCEGNLEMLIHNKIRKNALIIASLVFSSIPLLIFLWELLISASFARGSFWYNKLFIYPFPWQACLVSLWIAVVFLVIALIYRRVKHDKQYNFSLIFLLFSAQAFFAFHHVFIR